VGWGMQGPFLSEWRMKDVACFAAV
jgi:hypothetical protein